MRFSGAEAQAFLVFEISNIETRLESLAEEKKVDFHVAFDEVQALRVLHTEPNFSFHQKLFR